MSADPLDDLRVSVDSHTLDATSGKRRLRAIEPDGTLTYEDPKAPEVKLTERLERIWNEYPNGLLDLTEAQLEQRPPGEPAVEETKVEVVDKERDPSSMMDWEEMEQLRSDIFVQLNDARNELWFVLELAKTLAVSTSFTNDPPLLPNQTKKPKKKVEEPPASTLTQTEPPILPAGTYSTTPSLPPSIPLHVEAQRLELALAAKQQALDECSALIDSAVDELRSMSDAGDNFWGSIRALRDGDGGRGQWAIVPKPDFGRTMTDGERAKDVIIPYAVDEAPPALRARSLAAFDLDPQKNDLAFGARSHLRLRVTLGVASSTPAEQEEADVRAIVQNAQLEVFEEELFAEIQAEAARLGAVVEPRSVTVSVGEQELVFELYDSRSPPTSTDDAVCDCLLLCARLGLSRLHRQRKARILGEPSAPTPIVAPLVQVLRYRTSVDQLKSTLNVFATTMRQAGLAARVDSRFSASGALLRKKLVEEANMDALGGVFTLEIEGCVTSSVNSPAVIATSRASFPLPDFEDMGPIIADDLGLQLLNLAKSLLQQDIEDEHGRHQVFLDELDEVVSAGECGCVHIAIPAPFDTIHARLEPRRDERPEAYDSGSGATLKDWLAAIAARLSAFSNE